MTFVFSTSILGDKTPVFSIEKVSVADARAFLGACVKPVDTPPGTKFKIEFVDLGFEKDAKYQYKTLQHFLDAGNKVSWSL